MSCTRRFVAEDLFKFNNVNLDYYTETYNLPFYFQYLAYWPEFFLCVNHCIDTSRPGTMMGYVMGKAEGDLWNKENPNPKKWHGHVTALTVAPEYRRLGVANKLMNYLEEVSDFIHKAYFVDLFVRVSNSVAIGMYEKFGYKVYRTVLGYYSGEENGYDMRKAIVSRDPKKESEVPLPKPIKPYQLDETLWIVLSIVVVVVLVVQHYLQSTTPPSSHGES